jgi:hypothetical protein
MVESTDSIGFWRPKCMWPSQVEDPCEHDGEIILCNEYADYFVNGFSYCESHVKEYVLDSVEYLGGQSATEEYGYGANPYAPKTPEELQDDTDNEATGEWSFNVGQDEIDLRGDE